MHSFGFRYIKADNFDTIDSNHVLKYLVAAGFSKNAVLDRCCTEGFIMWVGLGWDGMGWKSQGRAMIRAPLVPINVVQQTFSFLLFSARVPVFYLAIWQI